MLMWANRVIRPAGAAVLCLFALVGCTESQANPGAAPTSRLSMGSPSVADPPSAGPASSPASANGASAPVSLSSASPTTDSTADSGAASGALPTPSVVDPSSLDKPARWPADLTAEQVVMAQTALDVYQRAWDITNAAYANPDRDWEPEIRQAIADPRAVQLLRGLRGVAADHLHMTGTNVPDAWVTAVEGSGDGARVTIEACVDSGGTALVNETAGVVNAVPSSQARVKQTALIRKFSDASGGWLLSEGQTSNPVETC